MITNACTAFKWSPDYVLHEIPLAQLFAMVACHAWGQGMEPEGENYTDREMTRILLAKQAERQLAHPTVDGVEQKRRHNSRE